jgi:hypothetical protein
MNLPNIPEKLTQEIINEDTVRGLSREAKKINELITFSHELVEYLKGEDEEIVYDQKFYDGKVLRPEYTVRRKTEVYKIAPSPEAPQEKECECIPINANIADTAFCEVHMSPTPESEVDVKALLEEYLDAFMSASQARTAKNEQKAYKRMSEIEEILTKLIQK